MIFLTLNIILIAISSYFLFLGWKVWQAQKPFLISAKYNFAIASVAFAAQLIIPIGNLFSFISVRENNFDLMMVGMPVFLVVLHAVLLFYMWKTMQGYMIIGVTEDTLRSALESVLTQLRIPFEERLSKMRLTDLDADLHIVMNEWAGVASVKIKDKRHKETERQITDALKQQFGYGNYPLNLRTSYFYLLTGGLMLVFFIGFSYWTLTRESFWRSF